jgi:gluconokinase
MGVSDSGKSTVRALLAERVGLSFIDGDDLHPVANKRKMACGMSLDDFDREPWLDAIAMVLKQENVVIACSALKRCYRDR